MRKLDNKSVQDRSRAREHILYRSCFQTLEYFPNNHSRHGGYAFRNPRCIVDERAPRLSHRAIELKRWSHTVGKGASPSTTISIDPPFSHPFDLCKPSNAPAKSLVAYVLQFNLISTGLFSSQVMRLSPTTRNDDTFTTSARRIRPLS